MTGTTAQTPAGDDGAALPRPRRESNWRWSRPRRALVAGGALAAVVGLGIAGGAGAAGATSTGRSPGGPARPTVAGKITALSGDDITLETGRDASVTVVYSSSTTFENGGAASSASALKVGDFIGVQGTESGDSTVTAATVVLGRPPGTPRGRTGGTAPRHGAPPGGAPTGG